MGTNVSRDVSLLGKDGLVHLELAGQRGSRGSHLCLVCGTMIVSSVLGVAVKPIQGQRGTPREEDNRDVLSDELLVDDGVCRLVEVDRLDRDRLLDQRQLTQRQDTGTTSQSMLRLQRREDMRTFLKS